MKVFEKIRNLAEKDFNEYLDAEKQKGRKIIGYFCSYVPEEILHAAGFIPYRMRAVGSGSTARGDVYFASLNCTFVRHCFSKALEGDFAFLEGVVFMNGCDHTRRMYDNWRHARLAPSYLHMFTAPHLINPLALDHFEGELQKFKKSLEDHFGLIITPESLIESLQVYNRKRALLAEISSIRKDPAVPIKGSEFLALMLAVTALPVEEAVTLLEEVREACRGRRTAREGDLRIFLSAGCVEEISHLELIEECGGTVVADNLCMGSRHFDTLTDPSLPPLRALAERYLTHLSCPRMMNDFRRRLKYMADVREGYAVDAIIAEKLKFCDLWGGEIFLYRQESKKRDFPLLTLERELYGGGTGQIRTRLQAFFEQIRNRRTISGDPVRSDSSNEVRR